MAVSIPGKLHKTPVQEELSLSHNFCTCICVCMCTVSVPPRVHERCAAHCFIATLQRWRNGIQVLNRRSNVEQLHGVTLTGT